MQKNEIIEPIKIESGFNSFIQNFNNIITTPLKVAIICILICLVPSVKDIFLDKESIAKLLVYDILKTFSFIINPLMLLQLGAALMDSDDEGVAISKYAF